MPRCLYHPNGRHPARKRPGHMLADEEEEGQEQWPRRKAKEVTLVQQEAEKIIILLYIVQGSNTGRKTDLKERDHGYAHARHLSHQNKFVGSTLNSKSPLPRITGTIIENLSFYSEIRRFIWLAQLYFGSGDQRVVVLFDCLRFKKRQKNNVLIMEVQKSIVAVRQKDVLKSLWRQRSLVDRSGMAYEKNTRHLESG